MDDHEHQGCLRAAGCLTAYAVATGLFLTILAGAGLYLIFS